MTTKNKDPKVIPFITTQQTLDFMTEQLRNPCSKVTYAELRYHNGVTYNTVNILDKVTVPKDPARREFKHDKTYHRCIATNGIRRHEGQLHYVPTYSQDEVHEDMFYVTLHEWEDDSLATVTIVGVVGSEIYAAFPGDQREKFGEAAVCWGAFRQHELHAVGLSLMDLAARKASNQESV